MKTSRFLALCARIFVTLTILTASAIAQTGSSQCDDIRFRSFDIIKTRTPVMTPITADFNNDSIPDIAAATGGSTIIVVLGQKGGGFEPARQINVGGYIWDIEAGDFNGDAETDILVTRSQTVGIALLPGDGAGNFGAPVQYQFGAAAFKVAKADFNRDGRLDLMLASETVNGGVLGIVSGGPNGLTIPAEPAVTLTKIPVSLRVGDFNQDGKPDVAVFSGSTESGWEISTYIGDGTGGFTVSTVIPAARYNYLDVADFDGDGFPDIAAASSNPSLSDGIARIFLNNRAGGFATPIEINSISQGSIMAVDANNDGSTDIVIDNSFDDQILVNDGTARFTVAPMSMKVGGAAADFNGDGLIDFAFSGGVSTWGETEAYDTIGVAYGRGGLEFGSTLSLRGFQSQNSIVAADFNGDGRKDIAGSSGYWGGIRLELQNSDGTFSRAAQNPLDDGLWRIGSSRLMAADVNNDGAIDLIRTFIAVNSTDQFLGVLINDGTGRFELSTFQGPAAASLYDVKTGDFNRDGHLDVFVPTDRGYVIYQNDGHGAFVSLAPQIAGAQTYKTSVVADFDLDGKLDFIIRNTNYPLTQYRGNGDGTFTFVSDIDTGRYIGAITVGDINGDGRPDIVAASSDGAIQPRAYLQLLQNQPSGGFVISESSLSRPVYDLAMDDVNQDGNPDIALVGATGGSVSVFSGDGDGGFTPSVTIPVSNYMWNVTISDLNGDKKPDLVVARDGNTIILANETTTGPCVSGADVTVAEGDSGSVNANFEVSLSAASKLQASVDYRIVGRDATSGADFTASSGKLTFAPGATLRSVSIPVLGDTIDEADETFQLVLSNPVNVALFDTTATATIVDNDGTPSVSVADASIIEGTATGPTRLAVNLNLSAASGRMTKVGFSLRGGTATEGVDFSAYTGVAAIPAGRTTASIMVDVAADGYSEPDETLFVDLTTSSGLLITDNLAVATILNDDTVAGIATEGVAVGESNFGATANFTVQLFSASAAAVTVNYATANGTATAPGDFQPTSGTLTFAPGETSKTISVSINGERMIEPDEVFYLDLSSPVNGVVTTPRVAATILNDDHGPVTADFDGDGRTDVSVFRPNSSDWWLSRSLDAQVSTLHFGAMGDTVVNGDFSGDGKSDIAIWRPSTGEWYVLRSEDSSYFSIPFGTAGDIPAAADFDGDGKVDIAVYRPSGGTWFIRRSSDAVVLIVRFGSNGDKPVTADYDGDGKSDIAIFRPSDGSWWIAKSSNGGLSVYRFGNSGDNPVPADFTGDGKVDIAVFRPSTGEWLIQRSEDATYFSFPFGASGDVPVAGDYDGDGKADAAVFRGGDWYVLQTSSGATRIERFGIPTDVPIPGAQQR